MKITEKQLRELIHESLSEVVDEYGGGYYPYDDNGQRVSSDYTNRGGWDDDYNDLDAVYRAQNARGNLEEGVDETTDEGRFGNFLSSVGNGAKEWWRNGGVDAFKQGYNQTMADKSAADAATYRKQVNAAYKDIPGADAVMQKYDGKIAKLTQQSQSLKQQIAQLKSQKTAELQQLRSQHMSKMTSKANKFGNTAKQASGRAQDAQNRRRASLGLDPMGQQGAQPKNAANLEESKLEKVIRESNKKYVN